MTTLLTILVVWFALSTVFGLFVGRIIAMQNTDGRPVVTTKAQSVKFIASTETSDTRATAEINALSFKPAATR